jgi:hypothetical protein
VLLPSGDLRVSGPAVVGSSPAHGLAIVLGLLLETAPCPAELRQLAETYEDAEFAGRDGAVARFAASLAFFERPGRTEVLAALASRAEPALERARRDAALEELTERTRQRALAGATNAKLSASPPLAVAASPAIPAPRPRIAEAAPPSPDQVSDGAGHRFLIPAIGIVVFLGMAYAAASFFSPAPPAAARGSDAARAEEDLPVSGPGLDQPAGRRTEVLPAASARKAGPGAVPPASAAPSASAHAGTPRPAAPASAPAAAAVPAPAEPTAVLRLPAAPAPAGVDVVVNEKDGRVIPPAAPPARPAPRVAAGRVFTNGDPKVTPAVLIRPHLPDSPPADVPEEQVGTLEFVVAESGAVEHVHLVSPANRYQERMIVAAAKTWQFQPATRDGHPVRFRTRIRVTL